MPSSRRRKSIQLRKQKKIVRKRKKKLQEVLLLHKKPFKKESFVVQEFHRRRDREHNKYKYLTSVKKKKLSKENKKLFSYVKKYKSRVAKKYNADLVKSMKKKGYFKMEINFAKKYSLVGKNVLVAVDKIVIERYNKNNTKVLVKGKWIGLKKLAAMKRRVVKATRIKSYQDILGVTKEKAKKILNIIDKKLPGVNELKALIY
jgi:hypothetical protein